MSTAVSRSWEWVSASRLPGASPGRREPRPAGSGAGCPALTTVGPVVDDPGPWCRHPGAANRARKDPEEPLDRGRATGRNRQPIQPSRGSDRGTPGKPDALSPLPGPERRSGGCPPVLRFRSVAPPGCRECIGRLVRPSMALVHEVGAARRGCPNGVHTGCPHLWTGPAPDGRPSIAVASRRAAVSAPGPRATIG